MTGILQKKACAAASEIKLHEIVSKKAGQKGGFFVELAIKKTFR